MSAPDLIGDEGRAEQVALVLIDIQKTRARLDAEVVANGLEMDSPAPGLPGVSVRGQYEAIQEAERRICQKYDDLLPLIAQRLGHG